MRAHPRRRRRLLGAGLALLLIGVIGGGWYWIAYDLAPLVAARASAALGRTVTIGRVRVSLGRITTVVASDVVVDNPPGWPAGGARLAVIPQIVVRFGLWRYLFHNQTDIPSIDLRRPQILIGELANHAANYRLHLAGASGSALTIGDLRIEGGTIHVVLAPRRADVAIAVATRTTAGATPTLVATARGTYAGQPITGHLTGGAILALRSATQPWPIDLRLVNGQTKVHLLGTIADPLALAGARLRLALAGANLGALTALTGLALPATPPFSLAGALDFAAHTIRLRDIQGRVGSSDLEGALSVVFGGPRPVLDANLQSRAVNLVDLGGFIGAKPGGAKPGAKTPAAKAAPGLLPNTPIDVPRFRNADVHLRYRAARVLGRSVPLDNMVAAIDIVDGKVTVHPVAFGVGRGRIAIKASLDPMGRVLRTDAEVDFQSLDVAQLMRATHMFAGAGALSGSARLAGTGDSLAAIVANGNGALLVGMAGGDLSAVLVDLSGLEFGNAVLSALGLPKTTDIACMVGNFALQRGILHTRALIIDTKEAIVGGTGSIDMRNNTIDMTLRTAPKHFSIGSLPGPIHISGSLKSPRILPGVQTVARAGIAGVLGAIFPPLALLPTIQFGTADHHRCDALLQRARQEAPGTRPPSPRHPAPGR